MNKRIFLSPPYMFGNERELVNEAFASNYIAPCGPMVERFEQALADKISIPDVCALSSCTGALDLLFHELGVGSGDTVFCSNLTFVASVAPAVHRGAEPVFIGSDAGSWTMSPEFLKEALDEAAEKDKLPKAVVAVDLYGQCCDYDAIEPICAEYGAPMIVDAAEALGAVYCDHRVDAMTSVKKGERPLLPSNLQPLSGCKKDRHAGDAGWATVYSFNGNKIITSSGGGALASRDEGVVQRALKSSQQSREQRVWYEHEELGFNYRMSNIVAAIGLGQLMNLDRIVKKKRSTFDAYRRALGDIEGLRFMPEAGYGRCSRWLTVITLPAEARRDNSGPSESVMKVIDALESQNIESRPIWKPMHMQPVFKECRVYGEKVDEDIFTNGLCLPSGTGLTDSDMERVVSVVKGALGDAVE